MRHQRVSCVPGGTRTVRQASASVNEVKSVIGRPWVGVSTEATFTSMGDVNICMETILRCAGAASACPYICSQRAYRASTISVAEYGSQSLRALRRWSHSARVGWSLHALMRAPSVGEYPPRHTCLWRLLGIHGRSSTLPRCCSYGIRPLRRRSRPMVRYSFICSFSTVWFTVSLQFLCSFAVDSIQLRYSFAAVYLI